MASGPVSESLKFAHLLVSLSDEHEREIAELRAHYDQQLEVLQRELDEAKGISASAAREAPIASASLLPIKTKGEEQPVVPQPSLSRSADDSQSPPTKSEARLAPALASVTEPPAQEGLSFEHYMDIVATVVVGFHIAFLIVQMQYGGLVIAEDAGLIDYSVKSDSYTFGLLVTDHAFNALFLLEMALRIAVLRLLFFKTQDGKVQWFNCLELALIAATSIELYLPFAVDLNFTTFRPIIRFVRILRVLRLMRMVKFCFKLHVLVTTVAASCMALLWSVILLVITMLIAALFLNHALVETVAAEEIDEERRKWIYTMFGTSTRAFYTVFELTFSGGWPNYARPLVEDVSALWAVFFFVYIIAVVFAMFRVITALFLRDTLALAANDAEIAIQEKMAQKAAVANKLHDFFQAADTSGDGMLSLEEFQTRLELPNVRAWLSLLEVDVKSATQIFELLEDEDNKVSVDDFVQGMMRIKGQAKAQEVYQLLILQTHMKEQVSTIAKRIDRMELLSRKVKQAKEVHQARHSEWAIFEVGYPQSTL